MTTQGTGIRWSTLLPGESPGSPGVVGDRLFLGAGHASLVCVAKRTGRILWVRGVRSSIVASWSAEGANDQ